MDESSEPSVVNLSPERIQAATDDLVALVDSRLPDRFYAGEKTWKPVLTAMVVRCSALVEVMAAVAVPERQSEALLLLRSLYEQAVTFLWLAIDPEPRVSEWSDHTQKWRQKLEQDARDYGVESTMSDEELEEELRLAPSLRDRADEVDEYWAARIAGFHTHPEDGKKKNILTLAGLYVVVYRLGSRQAHGTVDALDPYLTQDGTRWVVDRQRPSETLEWSGLAIALMGMVLVVTNELLGWPDESVVREIVAVLDAAQAPARADSDAE